MKISLSKALQTVVLFLLPVTGFTQTPILGTAAKFVLFTTNGAMTCSGTKYLTHLTGDVGSNLPGSITGFGNVDGVMHVFDAATGACAADVVSLYTQLSTAIPTGTMASPIGGGITLAPGVYSIPTAATLTGDLILDAAGDPGAVFIFQIGGVLSTNALSKVKLLNGALACNVFWQVGGAVNVGTGTFMRGTIVANGQIDLTSTLDTLEGRALAINAPVLASQLVSYTPIGCGSPYLTGPAAPALASTTAYGVFSSIGSVTSTPITYVIGDVGANSTTPTGFDPLNVTGTIHAMDPSAVAAAGDLTNVYNYLIALPTDIDLLDPVNLGHDLVLTPHSYQITGITQLTGDLILNAQGNPNAVFVIKITGSFTTGALSRIILANGTQAKNVYWKIDGAVNVFSNSVFNGTLVVAGAITLNTGDTLNGRALTINGAVAINGSYLNITPSVCSASPITGIMNVCEGSTTAFSDSDPGGTWESSNTAVATVGSVSGIVTGVAIGTSVIKFTSALACETTVTVTVNQSPGTISGAGNVCEGSATTLSDPAAGGTWTSSNILIATVSSASGVVTGITPGNTNITYTLSTGCISVKAMTVNTTPDAGTITGSPTVCQGSTSTLNNAATGGIWTSVNMAIAMIDPATGIVSGVTAGTATISYTIINACGTAATTTVITVDTIPDAGVVSGALSVCPGSIITLSNIAGGGIWTSVSTTVAAIGSASGIVTGVAAGTTTISYTVTNLCGTAVATKTLTVGTMPDAGTITGASMVCQGSTTVLGNTAGGGVWTSVNTSIATIGSASGLITGLAAGTTTISYTATTSCGTTATTEVITITPLPVAGSISGTSAICVGSSTTLTGTAAGGTWSSSNANATVAGGVVTGVAGGTADISYTVTNTCGTANAIKSITVNTLPNPGVITGITSVCTGSSITLTDINIGGTWSSSNINATVTGGVITGITAGTVTISYAITNICGTATTTQFITVSALPTIPAISTQSPASACTGTMYQNFGTATIPEANTYYTWTATNATVWAQGTNHQYALINFTTAGVATVILSATKTGTTCTSKSWVTVNVNAGAANTPQVLYFNNHFVCTPSTEDSYQWGYDDIHSLDSTLLAGEVNQDYLTTSPDFGNKAYWAMTTSGGCMQKTYYKIPTAVEDITTDGASVSVYPNPANSYINVAITAVANDNIRVEVLNMMGQKTSITQTVDNKATIDVATLPAGYYMIACYRNNVRIAVAKFIKN